MDKLSEIKAGYTDIDKKRLIEDVESLRTRLECNFAYDKAGNKIAVEPGSIPDGIDTRDETIRVLTEHLKLMEVNLNGALKANSGLQGKLQEAWEEVERLTKRYADLYKWLEGKP